MRRLSAITVSFLTSFSMISHAQTVLNIHEWEGYLSPFSAEFEKYALDEKGIDVKLNFIKPNITSADDIFVVARAKKADIVTPTHNYFKMEKGKLFNVLSPIDTSLLSNYSKVTQSLRNADFDKKNNTKYSVPLLGGSYGLAYNADRVPAPDSWNVLWDDKSKGKYAVTNDQYEANLYIALLISGHAPNTFYDLKKNKLNKADIQLKVDKLAKNAHSFWQGLADAEKMKELDYVTTYWFGVADANKQGQNWKMASPKEGQTVWLDTMSIVKHVNDDPAKKVAAHLLLDFMIQKDIQTKLHKLYGSVIVNQAASQELKLDPNFFIEEYLWQPLDSRTRNLYKLIWSKAMDKR